MKSVPEMLETAAETYRDRNAVYGDDYKKIGAMYVALFPNGLTVKTADDWQRLALLMAAVGKMRRYTNNFESGGHADSLLDLAVYSTMLKELDECALSSSTQKRQASSKRKQRRSTRNQVSSSFTDVRLIIPVK
jgi:hypothetical protein